MDATTPSQGDSDNQTPTFAVSGMVIVLALISVILRFYVRFSTRQGVSWDDAMILLAVVVTLITAGLLLWGNSIDPTGAEASVNDDPTFVFSPEDELYTKLAFLCSVLYFTIAGSTKFGILLMYHRIFSVSQNYRYGLAVASFLVAGWWLGCTVASVTNCIPLEYTWLNALDDPRYCFNFNIFWMASGVCETVIDLVILALPIQQVLRLQLSFARKLSVAGIFLLGGFVVVTGLVKIVLGYVPGERNPSFSRTEIWTIVHIATAIICASLPIYWPLMSKVGNSLARTKIWTYLSLSRHTKSYGSSTRDVQLIER